MLYRFDSWLFQIIEAKTYRSVVMKFENHIATFWICMQKIPLNLRDKCITCDFRGCCNTLLSLEVLHCRLDSEIHKPPGTRNIQHTKNATTCWHQLAEPADWDFVSLRTVNATYAPKCLGCNLYDRKGPVPNICQEETEMSLARCAYFFSLSLLLNDKAKPTQDMCL